MLIVVEDDVGLISEQTTDYRLSIGLDSNRMFLPQAMKKLENFPRSVNNAEKCRKWRVLPPFTAVDADKKSNR